MDDSADVTDLLDAVAAGDEAAYEALVPIIYERLHELAGSHMRREREGHTLQTTALVNEAFLRLVSNPPSWQNRAHFFGAASEAMRRVLIDYARRRGAEKRGADRMRVTFTDLAVASPDPDVDLEELNEALSALETQDARLAEVVRHRYFAGLSIAETADVLSISPATVKRDWQYARAWLLSRMSGE